MLIVPALAVLFTYVYWRPHQVLEVFQPLTIGASVALTSFALLLDMRLGTTRPRGSPLLGLLAALVVWCLLTVLIQAPERFNEELARFGTAFLVFVLVSEGLQSLRGVAAIGGVLLTFTVLLAAVGVHQGLSPMVCYQRFDAGSSADASTEVADGRSCESRADCYEGGQPGAEYNCEHTGLLGTHSIGGRVRYRGILEDPNELSWALAMGMPLAFAFYETRRSRRRLLALLAGIALIGACIVMTRSRGGQLALLATFGVYFVRRFRWRGLLAGAAVAIPLLLLGGRSGAEDSTQERLECWSEALSMWREHPLMGVGAGQFTEHHFLTAHNPFLLTLAELGPIGFVLWTGAIYYGFKIAWRAQVELAKRPEGSFARSWSMAIFASLVGLASSAMFLTLAYHAILWIFLGLVGALYAAVRAHDPDFRVSFGWRDLALVGAGDTLFIVIVAVYLRLKGI